MNKATMTDGEGRFRLMGVLANARLLVSYTGYEGEEIKLVGQREVTVKLRVGENKLSEAVVVAYGTSTQRSNTGAVTVVKGDQIQNLPNRSFDKSLQGLVPGLQITNGTGQPGGGVSSMVQRGISTGGDAFLGSTVRNPLILIDGIPVSQSHIQPGMTIAGTPVTNPLAQLNPSDIESISVLKDAAAIALYGSKSSNGVILITTKKGKTGKTNFNFRSQMDMAYLPKRVLKNIPDQQQYLQMLYDTYRNTNSTIWTDNAIKRDLISKFPYLANGGDTSFYSPSDWDKALFQNAAKTFTNELSISGGNEKSNFYLNIEYTKQDGIVKNTGYDRKSFRINFENKPIDFLTIGTKTTFSYSTQKYTNSAEGESTFGLVTDISPLNPIKNAEGKYMLLYPWGGPGAPTVNPVAELDYNMSQNVSYRGVSKLYMDASFLKYFTFSSSVGIDFMLSEVKEKLDPRFRQGNSYIGSIIDRDLRRANIITTNMLSFKMRTGKVHDINALFGQEAQIITDKTLGGEVKADSTALPIYNELTSPGYVISNFTGLQNRQTLLSWFGQLNYGYRQKYLISSSIRRDGSSRFGSRQQWGTYWSAGAGWVATEEGFFKNSNYVNFLKFRGSIGIAGNSAAVGPSSRFDLLRQGTYAGGTAIIVTSSPGNLDIRWEKTFSWNIGLDARLFRDKVSLTVDVYNKKTKDLIYPMVLPSVSGYRSVSDNIGDINNRGTEISISGNIINTSRIKWNVIALWSTNKNVLVKANVPFSSLTAGNLANEEGRNFNSFFLRQWAGVNSADGKPLWIDSSGKATSTYSRAKREFVGKPQPDGFGSFSSTFSYKRFELYFQLYYQYGNKILYERMYYLQNDGALPYLNQSVSALNFWKEPGDITPNPRRILNNSDGGNSASTRFLYDGDYIRLSNVTLSFNFPQSILDKFRLSQFRAFIQGNNLAVWTKIPDQDPDNVNVAGGLTIPYPNSKNFSFGVQANF